jgi:hypothetical protein
VLKRIEHKNSIIFPSLPGGEKEMTVLSLQFCVTAPIACNTGGAGIVEFTSTKICFEKCGIRTVYIYVTVKISVAKIVIGTGIAKRTPSKMEFEGGRVGTITVPIPVKITFTLTGITALVTPGRIEV